MNDLLTLDQSTLTPAKKVENLVKLQELEKGVKAKIAELRASVMESMKQNDLLQYKTSNYIVFRQTRKTPQIDHQTAITALDEMGVPLVTKVVLDMEYMKKPLAELEKKGQAVDGIEYNETETIVIRIQKS